MRSASPAMSHFQQIPQANIPRSTFDRTHAYKTTFNSAYLIPFLVDEVLPGDTFKVSSTMFARLSTPFVPVMDNIWLDVFYFFVPNRLTWQHFPNFMGEENVPGDYVNTVVSYLQPQITCPAGGYAELSLADYFGIPTKIANLNVNALPFRAYNLIYNEWFRDENLVNKAAVPSGTEGPDAEANYVLRKRAKRHDYFTSCLPWPQKGPGVMLPLGTSAPVVPVTPGTSYPNFRVSGGTSDSALTAGAGGPGSAPVSIFGGPAGGNNVLWSSAAGASGLQADLTNATAATINSLRQAFQIQRLYERDARGGSRYTELVRSHFGVISPDARLQRPEYLGGGSVRVNISPIAQTSATGLTGSATPQGSLAAIGTAAGRNGFTKSFVEHGIIMGLLNVRADMTYQQGLNKMWSRRTRFDHYWPALAHLGEQAVLNKEIYAQGNASDDQAFGYQERWAEYRYFPGMITGKLRSNATAPLDVWHLAQKFTALPTLNQTFIEEAPPINRILAVPSQPEFILDSIIDIKATRPMPTYSVPGLIDHF